jgi:hypothetical protein
LRGRCVHLHGFPVEKKRHFHTCRPAALPIAYGGVLRSVDATETDGPQNLRL